jgi:hypothetical protein
MTSHSTGINITHRGFVLGPIAEDHSTSTGAMNVLSRGVMDTNMGHSLRRPEENKVSRCKVIKGNGLEALVIALQMSIP